MLGQQVSGVSSNQLKSVEPRPMTDIEGAFSRLNEELNMAEKRLVVLRDKLRSVMAEVPQSKNVNTEGFVGSPMAQEIEQRTQRVRLFNGELIFILDSLQL